MKAAAVSNRPMFDTLNEKIATGLGVAVTAIFGSGWIKEHVKNRGNLQTRHTDELAAIYTALREEVKVNDERREKRIAELEGKLEKQDAKLETAQEEIRKNTAAILAVKMDFALYRERTVLMIEMAEGGNEAWRQIAKTLKQPHDVDELLAEKRIQSKTVKEQSHPRLLIVDDDQAIRHVFKIFLELAGYRVDAAEDGIAGLAAIVDANKSGDPYALAIVDVMMPGMDGEEIVRAIDSHNMHGTRMAFFTAKGQEFDSEIKKRGLGHIPVLHKPMEAGSFTTRVKQMLSEQGGSAGH